MGSMRCTLAALRGALIFTFAIGVATLRAAEIEVVKGDKEGLGLIAVTGELRPDDGEKFAAVAAPFTHAAVAFASPGGAVIAGLQMGQVIRLKGFATFSPEGAYCASACAIAWLAGSPRLMQPGSRIGFHAAYDAATREQTGVGNALIGAYLDRLGLSAAAIVYIEQASPDNITWLTDADARRVGINVTVLPATSEARREQPPEHLPDRGSPRLASKEAPPNTEPLLVAPLAPLTPRPSVSPAPAPSVTLEAQAQAFTADYFAHWSEANAQALGFFVSAYAATVVFYGETIDRASLMQKKRQYVTRWPVRVYTARRGSLRSFCNGANRTCVVTGIVDWDCRSPERNARSTGSANFSLTLSFADAAWQILAESGSVISRRLD